MIFFQNQKYKSSKNSYSNYSKIGFLLIFFIFFLCFSGVAHDAVVEFNNLKKEAVTSNDRKLIEQILFIISSISHFEEYIVRLYYFFWK